MGELSGKRITLGVTGGIAVYKAVELLRLFVKAGADVHVVMTPAATQFVAPLTFRELSFHPVAVDMFVEPTEWLMEHLSLAESGDIMVVAPATVNTLAKLAHGVADNLLCTTLLAVTAPVVLAPAADSHMWLNPITQENVAKLKRLGYHFVGPDSGSLARNIQGVGRMASPEEIYRKVADLLLVGDRRRDDWRGRRVLVTAGPTQEPIDPVRYLTNRSSGKMGYALAEAACRRGAEVTLVSGPVNLAPPAGVRLVRVQTTLEMREAALAAFPEVDVVFGAAAPADYRLAQPYEQKIKRSGNVGGGLALQLVDNPDIIAELGRLKKQQVVVAFAAETENLIENARHKLVQKTADLVVANDVTAPGAGFEVDTNQVYLVYPDGRAEKLDLLPKTEVAEQILDRVLPLCRAAG